ncbi:MAG: 4Fe-4S dicluster domain-containing protein [Desulfobacterales bacterium]|nr:4Fe-4S dicluster domain-containing protein [Desulfobacterales bacterium]
MGLINIDETRCKRDGLCAADCPTAVIHFKDKQSYPAVVPGGEQMCLRCGHCVAVCPHGALSHAEVPLAECPPIRKEAAVSPEQAVQFLRGRRSVRSFKDKPVERETLQKLIEIARYAPTASNAQLLEWVVINDPEKIHALAEMTIGWMRKVLEKDPQPASAPYMPILVGAWDMGFDAVLREAPGLVVAMAPRADANGMVDLTLALSYLELAAPSLGLGTCWAGLLQGALLSEKPLRQAVGIPEGHPHHYPMMIGYAKTRYYRLPERKAPRISWK